MPLARYTFLPWLRRGIANQLTQATTTARAQVNVSLEINSDAANPISKTVSLIGPGDVIGINQKMIVRTDPRNLITDFEPNYLASIEFYDEDFPWRYTPDIERTNHRLTPWIFLMVLKETEFENINTGNRPLSAIKLKANRNDVLPPPDDAWAWAHTHLNEPIDHPGNQPNLGQLNTLLANQPDRGVARLLCPRHLESNTAYHAFLIPTFEIGRKAGLGEPVADSDPALAFSWAKDETGEKEFPVYYRWFFKTAAGGDFETLVRLLQPRDMDKRVGIRDMDVQAPGFGMGTVQVSPDNTVGLEGALLAPTTKRKPEGKFNDASDFPEKIQPILNRSETLIEANPTADPVVTPPLYGKWHALTSKLQLEDSQQNWVHELNQDPRYRAPAGMGTLVVQKNQEEYMRKAWQQIGDVLSANQKIRFTQVAMLASATLQKKHLSTLDDSQTLAITSNLHKKVIGGTNTVHYLIQQSTVPSATLSGAFRKVVSPQRMTAKRFSIATPQNFTRLFQSLNVGKITAAPAKTVPSATRTLPAEVIQRLDFKADALRRIPARAQFEMLVPGKLPARTTGDGTVEIKVGADFRKAVAGLHKLMEVQVAPPPTRNSVAQSLAAQMKQALDPFENFRKRVLAGITKGETAPEKLDQVMAYPDIADAMYEPLVAANKEFFVPNLNLIPPNTISLMIPNQPFIESYMVGINHEFMRELLWREYPTDQRGTPFRQFWKPFGTTSMASMTPKAQAEKLKDIPPIHQWLTAPKTHLGDHNQRQTANPAENPSLVLVIKGDLLKRYSNTVIYAQEAQWGTDADNANRLVLVDTSGQANPDGVHIKNPIYKAQIDPDLHFIGFDLSITTAKGQVNEETAAEKNRLGNANLGWFFVIQEVPGEPRFGLDENQATNASEVKWDNLSWETLGNQREVIDMSKPFVQSLPGSNPDSVNWNTNSADLAYILFQKPVMVAVHAREMLRNLSNPQV
ncbi:hypothetical protein [Larkinella rosea]|uniref:Uncharacterized protein n=1 Tax=Larkinella rosea TaxID=2025312 RepID=A0A3P1C1Q9_9BACT|nr:hypothetical protein [Larkinella rosea]RRB07232.1 hypothetical protein EHT25_05490 [Larkinella rosea]